LLVAAVVAVLVHPTSLPSAGEPGLCDARPPWLEPAAARAVAPNAIAATTDELRVVTYNVHSGLGGGRALRRPRAVVEANLRTIAVTIAGAAPAASPVDVVGLNEVDFGSRRSGGFDQAAFLADELGRLTGMPYTVARGETWRRTLLGFEVRFGNAVLTRHAVVGATACLLDGSGACVPAKGAGAGRFDGEDGGLPALRSAGWVDRVLHEARGVVMLTLDLAPSASGPVGTGRLVDVLVTHLDAFVQSEREAQAAWLVARFVRSDRTTVLLGDVNAVPTVLTTGRRFFATDRTHDVLTSGALADARVLHAGVRGIADLAAWATFPSDRPVWPLDAVLATLDLMPTDVVTIGDAGASDHRGLAVRYAFASTLDRAGAVVRHDAMRRRQAARIAACDLESGHAVARRWLLDATGFGPLLAAGGA
jgi:endonuclease/exonuclease/phosphatase family metal-dependent hydrolase